MRPYFIAALFCTALPVAAQPAPQVWQAEPGAQMVLGIYYEAHYDPRTGRCSALRAPSVQILQAARQGTLSVSRARATVRDEPRCPGLRAPTVALVYRPATDARGVEELAWRVTYQSGQLGSRVYRGRVIVEP